MLILLLGSTYRPAEVFSFVLFVGRIVVIQKFNFHPDDIRSKYINIADLHRNQQSRGSNFDQKGNLADTIFVSFVNIIHFIKNVLTRSKITCHKISN
jgi:hypothetical protein